MSGRPEMFEGVDEIWLDGEFVDFEDAQIHVLTHALHYGTGVFEGVRCYGTEEGPAIFRWEEHLDRFYDSGEVYDIEKVVDYLDLPIQHASPRVLERMNRGYDPDRLRRQIDELRSIRPDLMLRTTALLGFPGETEEDVVALMDFLDEVRFDHLATFVYSHEQRTSAFHLDDDVDPEDKEDRRARVEALQWDLGLEVKRARLDREVEVMIDEVHADTDEAGLEAVPFEDGADPRGAWTGPVAFGRSEGFCYEIDGGIWMPGEDLSPGDVVRARLVGCGPFDFLAERTTLEGDA